MIEEQMLLKREGDSDLAAHNSELDYRTYTLSAR